MKLSDPQELEGIRRRIERVNECGWSIKTRRDSDAMKRLYSVGSVAMPAAGQSWPE